MSKSHPQQAELCRNKEVCETVPGDLVPHDHAYSQAAKRVEHLAGKPIEADIRTPLTQVLEGIGEFMSLLRLDRSAPKPNVGTLANPNPVK